MTFGIRKIVDGASDKIGEQVETWAIAQHGHVSTLL
jgi:hypothetical protein